MIRNAQNKAYGEGFDAGVSSPISEAERLARTFAAREGGRHQIRTQREEREHGGIKDCRSFRQEPSSDKELQERARRGEGKQRHEVLRHR